MNAFDPEKWLKNDEINFITQLCICLLGDVDEYKYIEDIELMREMAGCYCENLRDTKGENNEFVMEVAKNAIYDYYRNLTEYDEEMQANWNEWWKIIAPIRMDLFNKQHGVPEINFRAKKNFDNIMKTDLRAKLANIQVSLAHRALKCTNLTQNEEEELDQCSFQIWKEFVIVDYNMSELNKNISTMLFDESDENRIRLHVEHSQELLPSLEEYKEIPSHYSSDEIRLIGIKINIDLRHKIQQLNGTREISAKTFYEWHASKRTILLKLTAEIKSEIDTEAMTLWLNVLRKERDDLYMDTSAREKIDVMISLHQNRLKLLELFMKLKEWERKQKVLKIMKLWNKEPQFST